MLRQLDQDVIKPQPGPQEAFLSSPADIVIYGGAAGGGKTFGLLMEPLRHVGNPRFAGSIFRRTTKQVTNPGGLWEEAEYLYRKVGGIPRVTSHSFRWLSGATMSFHHLEHEKNKFDYQGAQIPYIGWDEVTHFTRSQFMYLLSRNRSTSGIRPYMRATCNPDASSFVADLIDWWIAEDGYPRPERSGVLRYFLRDGDTIIWADTRQELAKRYPSEKDDIKSFTFIPAKVTDNKILLESDPSYMGNLKALPLYEREQLLHGNWRVRPAAGMFFKRHWFKIVDRAPQGGIVIRYWDRAATEQTHGRDPAWTVGVRMRKCGTDIYVEHVTRFRGTPHKVKDNIKAQAAVDGLLCAIGIEQDPGQAGVVEAKMYVDLLPQYNVRLFPARADKITRALPLSAQCEQGNVYLVRGPWNQDYIDEHDGFDGMTGYMDQVDASSGAYNALTSGIMLHVSAVNVEQDSYFRRP